MSKLIRELEGRIAQAVIADLLKAGYSVSVNDGEKETVHASSDAAVIFAAMRTTDEDWLIAVDDKDGENVGWVRFVYGNSGYDVINDYTTNLESVLATANALADRYDG